MWSTIIRISQHKYSGSFCTGTNGLLQDLMAKDSIRGNLSVFASDIRAVREKGLEYILGETNSYACHVSDTYVFFCMSWVSLLNPAGRSWCEQYGGCGSLDAGLPLLCVSGVLPLRIHLEWKLFFWFCLCILSISSQIGISRIYFHQGIGYKYNLVSICNFVIHQTLFFSFFSFLICF